MSGTQENGIVSSSPQQRDHDLSPKSSEGGRESRDISPTKGKHDSSSAKKRRKKPRNIYVSPQKLRLLRQKQKEREEHKKKVGLADAMTGDGIHYGSASQDQVNNAFEEDFGPLLRGEVVVVEDTQSSANSVAAAVDLLLGTAMGEIGLEDIKKEDEEGASINMDEIGTEKGEGDIKDMPHIHGNMSPVISLQHGIVDSSLQAPSKERVKGGSPSYQLLAEAEKDCEKHHQATEGEELVDARSEVRKITPLMKESVLRVPIRNLDQTDDEGTSRSGSQSPVESADELDHSGPMGLEILDDTETYLSRPIERRLSFGPDDELQERIARGIVTVSNCEEEDEEEDVVMVNCL